MRQVRGGVDSSTLFPEAADLHVSVKHPGPNYKSYPVLLQRLIQFFVTDELVPLYIDVIN